MLKKVLEIFNERYEKSLNIDKRLEERKTSYAEKTDSLLPQI